jgi:D-alanyl-lipoteichoic acid acyltransferase DltB (MBOAT superfamily)
MWPVIRRPRATLEAPHRRYAPIPRAQRATAPQLAAATAHPELFQRLGAWKGLYAGEPETCRRNLYHFLSILAHLGLMWALFRVYRVEGRAFQTLVLFALAALPVHYLLPFPWKKPLFVALSAVGLANVFGLETAGVVIALSVPLIGFCYLPITWQWRAGLVCALTAALAFLRSGLTDGLIPPNVWPVLATMFMFRMVLYLYELKHAKKTEPLLDTLGYFFLLPNYCFLHFPVVDYRALKRGYFAQNVHATQRAGLQMMFRGTTHLLLYRLVYHEMLITPEEVRGPLELLCYLVCNYLLYLRVSGQFHVACGILHLFGYSLPETHRRYLLAESFTDYWRRINIYWKDFMVRVVFNPVVFSLKRWPQPVALAVATAVVFLTTWALHAYQSFWLRGSWGWSVPDALFWGILGLLVLVNVQLDARRSAMRSKRAREAGDSPRALALRALRVAGTFTTIALLWSLWSSASLGAWIAMLGRGLGH